MRGRGRKGAEEGGSEGEGGREGVKGREGDEYLLRSRQSH